MAVSAYNVNDENFDYYHEQEVHFGRSASLAYKDNGPDGSNLYVGGSNDHCYVTSTNDPKCWTMAIARLTKDGTNEKTVQINPAGASGYHDNEENAPYIDHMHIDGSWMFGTTRSDDRTKTGDNIFVWKLDLDAQGNPRSDNLQILKIDPPAFPGVSHVTGVKPTLDDGKIHMVYFQGEYGGLFYLKVDLDSGVAASNLLYVAVYGMMESVFIGSQITDMSGV
jgi:hypothetical protein